MACHICTNLEAAEVDFEHLGHGFSKAVRASIDAEQSCSWLIALEAPVVREAASAASCEPQTGSKRTASWKSPRATTVSVPACPTLGIKQPFPQPALPLTVGEDPLADQSSSNVSVSLIKKL
jgi:hypothetical protein